MEKTCVKYVQNEIDSFPDKVFALNISALSYSVLFHLA